MLFPVARYHAPVSRKPPTPDIVLVNEQAQIEEFCAQARQSGRFAFDTEFVMEDVFETELCLVQLAVDHTDSKSDPAGKAAEAAKEGGPSTVALIDPFLQLDLRLVWELICDPNVETVVHAGQEDLGLCVQHTGKPPRNLFDVQIAAGLAGYEYPLSLQRLVHAIKHVRLHKAKTLTDWRKRPLSQSQITYAAEDVRFLPGVRDQLHHRLSKQKRLDWATEEFARFEDPALYEHVEEEKLLRVKGMGSLRDRQLAIARELLTWREGLARRYNRPVRAVLKDHLLVEIAKLELHTSPEIRDLRGINLGDRDVRSLCETVARAMLSPRDLWPKLERPPLETPEDAALIALLTAILRGYCDQQEIAYGLVATKDSIRQLVQHDHSASSPETALTLLSGWRGRTIGRMLQEVLSGKRGIHVDHRDGRRRVRVENA